MTEEQIVQALAASGFDSAPVRLCAEKLINRRDQMISDLGLSREIPPLRAAGANHNLSYIATTDGPVTVHLTDGATVMVKSGSSAVKDGRIVTVRKTGRVPGKPGRTGKDSDR